MIITPPPCIRHCQRCHYAWYALTNDENEKTIGRRFEIRGLDYSSYSKNNSKNVKTRTVKRSHGCDTYVSRQLMVYSHDHRWLIIFTIYVIFFFIFLLIWRRYYSVGISPMIILLIIRLTLPQYSPSQFFSSIRLIHVDFRSEPFWRFPFRRNGPTFRR